MFKLFCLMVFFYCFPLSAQTYIFHKDNNKLTWKASGSPGALSIIGTGGVVEGTLVKEKGEYKGELSVDVRAFKTDVEKRDEHLQGYLQSDFYPKATLKLTKVDLKTDQFEGLLTIKGIEKPVSGQVSYQRNNFKAIFKLKLSDYPIGKVKYLGVGIDDIVEVEVNAKI